MRQVPHAGGSKSLVFLPDGRTLATAGNDQTIRFWCLLGGRELEPLEGHKATVNALALAPDGQTLLSASNDNSVRLWSLSGRTTAAKPAMLPDRQLEANWLALGRDEGSAAYDAVGALIAAPAQTLPLLAARLHPAAAPDVQKISALIADTGHARFAVRQKATDELEQMGSKRKHICRKRRPRPRHWSRVWRAERLLVKLQNGGPTGDMLRGVRGRSPGTDRYVRSPNAAASAG